MNEALSDTTSFVSFQSGCIGEYYMLSEYLNNSSVSLGLKNSPINRGFKDKYLSNEQFNYLDSIYNYRISNKSNYFNQLPENKNNDYMILINSLPPQQIIQHT
jgi:hypothetical protein